jgi:phosphate butyryltransferase
MDEFIKKAHQKINELPKKRVVAVAAADAKHVLEALKLAGDEGLVEPLLYGDAKEIKRLLDELEMSVSDDSIIHTDDVNEAAFCAVQAVREGRADLLMKGRLHTAEIMRPIIDKDTGILELGNSISLFSINEMNKYDRLLVLTDTGLIRDPTLDQKRGIIENAVRTLRSYGYDKPKVAIACAVETVNPKMPETVDAAALTKMNREGVIQNCIVEGPISMDIAFYARAAKLKGYKSEIAGEVDVVVWPNVLTGNIAAKGIAMFGGRLKALSFAVGAKVPLIITSRGADVESEYLAILGAVAAC